MKCILISILSLLLSVQVFAIKSTGVSETQFTANLSKVYEQLGFGHNYDPIKEQNYFVDKDGMKICFAEIGPKDAKNALVFVPGMGESYFKYIEFFYDIENLTNHNVRIYLFDHPGQGFSDRASNIPFTAEYIDDFNHYEVDLKQYMDQVVLPDIQKNCPGVENIYMLTHSMGGAVGAGFLEKYNNKISPEFGRKDYFNKAILSSPMMMPIIPKFIGLIPYMADLKMYWIAKGACDLGYGKSFGATQGPRTGLIDFSKGGPAVNTQSKNRFEFFDKMLLGKIGNAWFDNKKDMNIAINGVTWKWLEQSHIGSTYARKHAGDIDIPITVFQAGNDKIVVNKAENKFYERLNEKFKNGIVKFKDAMHETLFEKDSIRGDGVEMTPGTAIYDIINGFNLNGTTGNLSGKYI